MMTIFGFAESFQVSAHEASRNNRKIEKIVGFMNLDLFDRLKSVSRGYASLDYAFTHFQVADLIKMDILINGTHCMALHMEACSRESP